MGILENRTIVISGGSRGIGLEIAKMCAIEGAQLILISRHKKNLKEALDSLGETHRSHRIFPLDVSREEKVKEISKIIEKDFRAIHGLVNCAGIIGAIGRTDGIDTRRFRETININLLGTFFMCHYFIPLLLKASHGKIVNFSGGGATRPFPNFTAYAISKIGVVKLTENLAAEFRETDMDMNVVSPGFVATGIHQETIRAGKKAGEEYLKETINLLKQGSISPKMPASLVLFLLSSKSDGISGKLISAPWDPWEEMDFQSRLRKDKNFATLRRIDSRRFFMKK